MVWTAALCPAAALAAAVVAADELAAEMTGFGWYSQEGEQDFGESVTVAEGEGQNAALCPAFAPQNAEHLVQDDAQPLGCVAARHAHTRPGKFV